MATPDAYEGDLAERYSELAPRFDLPEFRSIGPGEPGSPFSARIQGEGELCWDPAEKRLAAFVFRGELEASAEPRFEITYAGLSSAISFSLSLRGILHTSIDRSVAE